jgi:hypothetical protein
MRFDSWVLHGATLRNHSPDPVERQRFVRM